MRGFTLGVFSILVATGSAIFPVEALSNKPVYVKILSIQNPNPHCIPATVECSDAGYSLCIVTIEIDLSPGLIKHTNVRKTTPCVIMRGSINMASVFNPPDESVSDVVRVEQQ